LNDITLFHEKEKAQNFLDRINKKKPLFVCVIATTETAKIPGISAAGANPQITDYTPPADVELLLLGKCRCISGVPVTPEGIPTPALISTSALQLARIPILVANAGTKIKPMVPFIDLGGSPGRDIRAGRAVENAEGIFQNAQILGEHLAETSDYIVIGESIPGGTTTALGVLLAMGVDAKGKVSSSMPSNPHRLKIETVETGLKNAQVRFGDLKGNPLKAIEYVGDPMIAAAAGIVTGTCKKVPVLMAGGTQMTPILATTAVLSPKVLDNVAIGTTRWITQDSTSDLRSIVSRIARVPILTANIDFSSSKHSGLRVYETGVVKEGVGAGGAVIAAIAKSGGTITLARLNREIERNYDLLVGSH
jgi:uncharacterized protein (TIGR00303 family)